MRMGLLILWLCLYGLTGWATGLVVDLNASQIEVGQQVRLTLTYDPNEARGLPDWRPLQTDFVILATEQSTSYTVMNGQARSIGQWGLILEPKHTGMITIPALRIGSLTSAPIQLNVNPSTHPPAQAQQQTTQEVDSQHAAMLQVRVDPKKPYLNQEILYKVRLMSRHRLLDVRYQPPQVEDAILMPLGEGQQYQTTRQGVVYHVEEQSYAIFPQKSGPLPILPPTLQALAYVTTPQQIALTGDAVTLDVQPLPKHCSRRQWLPSKLVHMQETYDQSNTALVQGSTIVRTIELQAQGLVAQLLPEISFPDSSDLRTYVDPAERDNRVQQGELWGRTKIKITYVFPTAGTIVLPAIRVNWFNVQTQQLEIAELPAKTYTITARQPGKQSNHQAGSASKNSPLMVKPLAVAPKISRGLPPIALPWGAGMLVLLGLLLRFGYGRFQQSLPFRRLRAACQANDVEKIKETLVDWGRQQWPDNPITHFTDLLALIPKTEALHGVLQAFSAYLYRAQTAPFQGKKLWKALVKFKQSGRFKCVRESVIPPLHPSRTIK